MTMCHPSEDAICVRAAHRSATAGTIRLVRRERTVTGTAARPWSPLIRDQEPLPGVPVGGGIVALDHCIGEAKADATEPAAAPPDAGTPGESDDQEDELGKDRNHDTLLMKNRGAGRAPARAPQEAGTSSKTGRRNRGRSDVRVGHHHATLGDEQLAWLAERSWEAPLRNQAPVPCGMHSWSPPLRVDDTQGRGAVTRPEGRSEPVRGLVVPDSLRPLRGRCGARRSGPHGRLLWSPRSCQGLVRVGGPRRQ